MRQALIVFLCGAGFVHGGVLSPAWVELAGQGRLLARVVVSDQGQCPAAEIDGVRVPMVPRLPVPEGMSPVCEIEIPRTARAARVQHQVLALPRPDPSRIVVVGDTGCRIKGDRIQDCLDPAQWPFERMANRAAREKPDLVIHVGDFLYREDKCPEDRRNQCGTGSAGDRWDTWNADFFKPAAKLLAAAPWAFSRGNHEECARSWRGWFYYLDPRPWANAACDPYSAPYLIELGQFELLMLDSSAALDNKITEEQVARYAAQLDSIHPAHAWLVDHHPFWGMKTGDPKLPPAPLTAPLAAAWERVSPKGIDLIVSGHTHLFALLSFGNRPPQLISGDGGTALAAALPNLDGMAIDGTTVVSSASRREWGYTLLTRAGSGWKLALKRPQRGTIVTCSIRDGRTACGR